MASKGVKQEHAIVIPFPSQGHVTPLLHLAKLLHSNHGFFITFVLPKSYQTRFIDSHGPGSLTGLPRFRFESIPDGVDLNEPWSVSVMCRSVHTTYAGSLKGLVDRLNRDGTGPPATCLVSDGVLSFSMKVAEQVGIPSAAFWTMSGVGYLSYVHIRNLIDNGLVPFQDASNHKDGYLDTPISCIPGMKNVRLKDLPKILKTTDIDDFMLNFMVKEIEVTSKASAIILNTFEVLEQQVLNALSSMKNFSRIYSIGPLDLLVDQIPDNDPVKSIAINVWNEKTNCMDWLDLQKPNSVVYVNFGSLIVMTMEQLTELAWGLANSRKPFLWVIRPDLISGKCSGGDYCMFSSQEFIEETKDRSLVVSWCPQKEVLKHESIAGFLTHNGWNSTLESISAGVPMICWPFSGEQPTNSRYCCLEWEIGVEIDKDMTRGSVEMLVKMLMDEERGKEMKRRAKYWQKVAQEATNRKGSSKKNLDTLVNEVLMKMT